MKNILLIALRALALGLASVGGAALDLAGGKPGLSGGSGAGIVTAGGAAGDHSGEWRADRAAPALAGGKPGYSGSTGPTYGQIWYLPRQVRESLKNCDDLAAA